MEETIGPFDLILGMIAGRAEVDGVGKAYDARAERTKAIGPLNMDIVGGEFVSVDGLADCGSTLLYLVAGFLEPTAGTIAVDGEPVSGPGTDCRAVFQEYAFAALYPGR